MPSICGLLAETRQEAHAEGQTTPSGVRSQILLGAHGSRTPLCCMRHAQLARALAIRYGGDAAGQGNYRDTGRRPKTAASESPLHCRSQLCCWLWLTQGQPTSSGVKSQVLLGVHPEFHSAMLYAPRMARLHTPHSRPIRNQQGTRATPHSTLPLC